MIKLRILLQSKKLYLILLLISLIYSTCYLVTPRISKYDIKDKIIIGEVLDVENNRDKLMLIVKGREKLLVYYYFNNKNKVNIKIGNRIRVDGKVNEPTNNTIFNLFNYRNYLHSKSIYYYMNASKIEVLSRNVTLIFYLKQLIIDRIDKSKNKDYLTLFILGEYSYINPEIKTSYKLNGILHLFSISGTHVALISATLLFLLGKLNVEIRYKYLSIFFVLGLYASIINFPASLMRSIIFFGLYGLSKIYYLKIKNIYILILTFSLLIIYNPLYIYDIGFEYSFIIVSSIMLGSRIINRYKNYFIKSLVISLISFLASLPLVLYYNYEINSISPLINIFYIPFVTYYIFPLSLLSFVIPTMEPLLTVSIQVMEKVSIFFSGINQFVLVLGKPNPLVVIIYYMLFYLMLLKYKFRYFVLIIILLYFNYTLRYFNSNFEITFIDVGQGDSILISYPYSRKNILIDTGGRLANLSYNLSDYTVIPYIKSLGIKKIDILILTHGDYDHAGEVLNIISKLKIKSIVMNDGKDNQLEEEIKEVVKYNKIRLINIKNKTKISFYRYSIYLYNYRGQTENSDSIVTSLRIYNKNLLMMGDATTKEESRLLNEKIGKIDILKVGHHGSFSSSSESFLKYKHPKYSVISVGLKNIYKHPDSKVISRLNKYSDNVLLTSINGSIKFIINNDIFIKEECKPFG